ncbi:hypothetical protein VTJ49DRAFT_7321 [Mycothermus thermophilus]|uniref:Nonselective cation channel n=1 Tax=Humicola insolens TaxID=85995 RepID=A0ABR3VH61_HUMIN
MGNGPVKHAPASTATSNTRHNGPGSRRISNPESSHATGRDELTPAGPAAPITPRTPATPAGLYPQSSIRIQEPPERRPLLGQRAVFAHNVEGDVFSCHSYGTSAQQSSAPHRSLPVYTNIHRIRRDITSVVEDYLSLEQLRDVRLNISVLRPLVDKLYEQDDISIVYCLLVNRAQFLAEQAHLTNRQNVNYTRAMLCELIATRILRRFNEDNEGPRNLLVLAHVLIAGFQPFQGAPEEILREVGTSSSAAHNRTMPALEDHSVDAIYEGRVVYTPSSFKDIIPDRYKQRPISLYNPREAPLLNHYRLVVPRIRNYLEIAHFAFLLTLYLVFMSERDWRQITKLEVCFTVYALGWVLDQFATLLEHGWDVYAQNLWSFLDVTFGAIFFVYLAIRIYGVAAGTPSAGLQALDVLAMGAPVLVPRLAFNLLSDNLVFLSLRSMMSDFALLSALAAWCFLGFLLSLFWLGNGTFGPATISKWMIYIWFGLDGSGIQHSVDFHKILGPSLMVAFAFLGNTLFLTILVSMLSTTFSHIVSNAPSEIQFRRAVVTLEGVKGDAIFAYPPPFNVLAFLLLIPLRRCVSPRWFHKIHVLSVRLINFPILLAIAFAERQSFSSSAPQHDIPGHPTAPVSPSPSSSNLAKLSTSGSPSSGLSRLRIRRRFWDRWRITTHGDISAVFEVSPPDSVHDEITTDDDLTRHLIRRQFARLPSATGTVVTGTGQGQQQQQQDQQQGQDSSLPSQQQRPSRRRRQSQGQEQQPPLQIPAPQPASTSTSTNPSPTTTMPRIPNRRDSIAPFPGLRAELQNVLSESDEAVVGAAGEVAARLDGLEERMSRLETLLERLVAGVEGRSGDLGKDCKHRWATITNPCYPGMGFDNCPTFMDGQVRPDPPRRATRGEKCPKCDLKGEYDRNQTRMVTSVKYGFRWGLGPNKSDPGVDVTCCVM